MNKTIWRRALSFLACTLMLLWLVPHATLKITYPKKYADLVEFYAYEYGVPPQIVYAIIKTESNFDPHAISSAGAIGLMQIMPSTFEWLTKILNETHEASALYDPEINIRYGTFFLNYLYDYYGNYQTTFAAYNAGMGNVSKWLASEKYSDGGKLISIPFSETANYVRVVTARAEKYQKIYKLKG